MADHGTLRVPAASPSRRDYQLRSGAARDDEYSSRPQSPWLPRVGDETMSPFRLYESSVVVPDGPNSRSGPLPNPSCYRRQLVQSGSFAGRLSSEEWNGRRRRNCVSGELGRTFELVKSPRGCKSGEIVGLEIRADGIFPIPKSSSSPSPSSLRAGVRKHSSPKLESVRKHSSPSGSIIWEALNDADNDESPRRERVVPVPFKWEQTSSSPSYSRITSDRCSTGSAKLSKAEPGVGSSAVPFKWELAPGKPKELEVEKTSLPALQLPPRLSSMKQRVGSWSPSSASRHRSLSASLSSKHVLDEPPSPSSTSSPRRPRHLSQFGTPQYQSAEYNFCCEDRARSPTSTLCGPGTPSSSSSSSSYSRKPSSVSYSGTSLESFDRWDHVSPTSRHSYAESQDSNSRDDRDPIVADGAIVKLRRKLRSSKPPRSPMRAPSGEEFFDCQQALAPSPSPRIEEPATRLPYKMPPSPAHEIEPLPSSLTRAGGGGGEFSHCLQLPRFLSRSDTAAAPCLQWLENPSWDSTAAPSSSLEDGYRSPAYKATLDLLSPSPDLLSQKSRSSSSRRRHSHLVEVLCNSLKQSLQRCTKRSVTRTHSIGLYDDQFTKRHQSFMW